MNNSSKIIISVLDFIICAVIGYMGTNVLSNAISDSGGRKDSSMQDNSASSVHTVSDVSSRTAPFPEGNNGEAIVQPAPSVADKAPDLSTSPSPQPSPEAIQTENPTLLTGMVSVPEILSVSTPHYDNTSSMYSFKVTASGVNLTFNLADARKNVIQSNQTGDFCVQPSASGKYYVYVNDSNGNKSEYKEVNGCFRLVSKVTKDEFQEILNTGKSQSAIDADFSNRVSSGCIYEFVGINEDEDSPKSYNEILNRIKMKTWSSVTVLSVTHSGETNKLIRARIQVNY